MQIWVDADACPSVIKDILFRAAERVQVRLTLVANQPVATPPSLWITSLQVRKGFDAADNEIVRRLRRSAKPIGVRSSVGSSNFLHVAPQPD